MSLRARLTDDMKTAMKAGEKHRLGTVRLILAALKDRDIANRSEDSRDLLGDDDILSLLAKMVKQREESADTYDKGNRPELAANERAEIAIIREYLPKQMEEAEAKSAIAEVIAATGATSPKDMGKVMAALKDKFAGQMDFGRASALVKDQLTAQ